MMLMSQAANVLHAELIGADAMFTSVSKDTRDIVSGSLYIAIKGERFDGHAFVEQARAAGAAGAIVSEQQSVQLPQILVRDTRLALGALAASWRQQFSGRLVGITGSNGKTTVKEMIRDILQQSAGTDHVLSTQGNLNNDIGMPMTLLNLRAQHQFAVIEMGANHAGEIDYLTHIAQPHVAVITNAGPAHLEGFGSVAKVASAKAEIYSGIVEGGTAVINADDTYADYWRSVCAEPGSRIDVLTFSMRDDSADIYAAAVNSSGDNEIRIETPSGAAAVRLAVPGQHNVMNALAATSVAVALDIGLDDIIAGLNRFGGVSGRLATVRTSAGARIINDTYNANPVSLHAAMQVLVAAEGDTWLVLGDMAELGDDKEELHRKAGEQARALGIRHLLATGELTRFAVEAFGSGAKFFEDRQQLINYLEQGITEHSVVLVKGSRSMGMEQIVNALVDEHRVQEVH
ncbi:MAG: UDP-N-acetylmuramoyl-tripeptide--D-alanyl-D-alanine ligase [Gammaproteobacteria bacterium]|jgi:UDP-N-acetylmuramoyl-tripeptide--D-alanyl-D-alanine ligase